MQISILLSFMEFLIAFFVGTCILQVEYIDTTKQKLMAKLHQRSKEPRMGYIEELGTVFFEMKADPTKRKNWRSHAIESTSALAAALVAAPQGTITQEQEGTQENKALLENLKARGLDVNDPATKELINQYSQKTQEKRAYVTLNAKFPDQKVVSIGRWVKYMDWPGKKETWSSGMSIIPQVFCLGRKKDFVRNDESPNTPIMPLDESGRYAIYIPMYGTPPATAKVGFGKDTRCKANYTRFPAEGESHGKPVYTPDWLKRGEGCDQCIYAPHRDRKLDDEYGIVGRNACKEYTDYYMMLGGFLHKKPGYLFCRLSVTGSMAIILQKETALGKPGRQNRLIEIFGIKLTQKGSMKKRILQDCTDPDQVPMTDRNDVVFGQFLNIVTNKIREYHEEDLKPKNAAAPPTRTGFDSGKYKREEPHKDELPDIELPGINAENNTSDI